MQMHEALGRCNNHMPVRLGTLGLEVEVRLVLGFHVYIHTKNARLVDAAFFVCVSGVKRDWLCARCKEGYNSEFCLGWLTQKCVVD